MTEDEDRHADEVNIAFQMGAEWQKKQNDSAWKGIHEGAVKAMQARINELEAALKNVLAELNSPEDDFPLSLGVMKMIVFSALGEKND
jgi:hypothetical protein